MNDWKNLNDESPCIGWICDVLLPDGTIIENVEAVEVEDDKAFCPKLVLKNIPKPRIFENQNERETNENFLFNHMPLPFCVGSL
jgi:hypothetical protein